MTKTMIRSSDIDIDAWEERRVPRDVLDSMLFIQRFWNTYGTGPTWREIAIAGGWPMERTFWRTKMKRLRRYGVKYRLNEPGSTKISGNVIKYVRAAMEDS